MRGGDTDPEMMPSSPGSVGLARAHPLEKKTGYGTFPSGFVVTDLLIVGGGIARRVRF